MYFFVLFYWQLFHMKQFIHHVFFARLLPGFLILFYETLGFQIIRVFIEAVSVTNNLSFHVKQNELVASTIFISYPLLMFHVEHIHYNFSYSRELSINISKFHVKHNNSVLYNILYHISCFTWNHLFILHKQHPFLSITYVSHETFFTYQITIIHTPH